MTHPLVKFDSDSLRESDFITFFICHVILYDHVFNRLCDMMGNSIRTYHSVKFGSHRSRGSWDIMFSICHVITWLRDQSVKKLSGWWSFTINLHLVKFGSHRPRGSEDISFLISHVTLCGYVIVRSSLPIVVAISLVEVEIWSILIFNVRRRKCVRYYKVRQLLQSET